MPVFSLTSRRRAALAALAERVLEEGAAAPHRPLREYADAQKRAEAQKVAEQFPENRTRPADAQGCLLGFGRCIMPGDKDYKRGSLNPNRR